MTKTLIIDLDETLIRSFENPDFLDVYGLYTDINTIDKFHSSIPSYSMTFEDGKKTRIWGIFRPYTKEFLQFVQSYFDNVIIWSAGTDAYVDKLVEQMFKKFDIPYTKIIFARSHCSRANDNFHKPIASLTESLLGKYYNEIHIDPSLTLILDDKEYTFYDNENNGVLIPAFCPGHVVPNSNCPPFSSLAFNSKANSDISRSKVPTLTQLYDRSDRSLMKFTEWLNRPEVRNATDYRTLDKSRIFT